MNTFSNSCLLGKSFLITGASSGLGFASAKMISECGGRVVASGRDEGRLSKLIEQLKEPQKHAISCFDLNDADSTAAWMEELANEHGPFDGIFHSAGIEMIRPIRMVKQAQIESVLSSSLYPAFGIARAAFRKSVLLDGGSLIYMSSVAALRGQRGLAAYSSAKAAVDGMVRALVEEFSERRIRVNSVAAGAVNTPMHQRIVDKSGSDAEMEYVNSHPLGIGNTSDIAQAVIFLLSDASKWVTGTCLVVDGGYSA